MTEQEINKLALDYVMTQDYFTRSREMENVARDVIKTILRDHCIVRKDKLQELYGMYSQHECVTGKKGLHEAMLIARGSMASFRDLFGTELFEESSGESLRNN